MTAVEARPITERARREAPSRRARGRHAVLAWIAGFLVVLLGAELAVRVGSNKLDDPLLYFSADAQRLVDDMNVLQRAHVRSDLTFVGTSMVRRDVAANDFEGTLPGVRWAHNVALPGAQSPVVERWMLQEVVPRIHPKRVVWGISSIDFNDGRPNKTIDQYNTARQTEPGFYAKMDRDLEKLAISKYRDTLRDPLSVVHDVEGKTKHFDARRPLQDRAVWKLGFPKVTAAKLARLRAGHKRTVRDKQLANFRVGKLELDAYTHTLRTLRAQGIDVAVVIMPVPTGFLPLHPHGEADYLAWKQLVTQAARRIGVPVVDMSRSMPDSGFRDYEHLNAAPARVFSKKLDTELEKLHW